MKVGRKTLFNTLSRVKLPYTLIATFDYSSTLNTGIIIYEITAEVGHKFIFYETLTL